MTIRKATDGTQVRNPRIRTDTSAPPPSTASAQQAKKVQAPRPEAKPTVEAKTAFVPAKDDVPVENLVKQAPVGGGKNVLAARIASTSKSKSPLTSAEARLRALLGKAEPPPASKAPKPEVLEKMIAKELSFHATLLSATEIANALGAPSWAPAVAELGAESAMHQPHWLLAVHLTKWMENIAYTGATLDEVAQSFKAAHPDVALRFNYLDGAFVGALQKIYPFMPQWKASVAKPKEEGAWDALFEAKAPPDPMQAHLDQALTALTEVPLTMKLTGNLADDLIDKHPFRDANVVMVQHMLGQANPLVDAMVKCGMDVSRAEYVGIPYQRNPAVKTTLEQGHGVKVTVPEVGNIDDMWRVITEAVDRAYERHLQNGQPILIMDDGGYGSKYIAEKYKGKEHLFRVVEQTTRGLTEISKIPEINFPIVDVAGSYGKRFESARVGDAVKMAVRRVLDAVTTTPTRKDVLIVGAGKVGEGVADSFAGDGARVTVFDPFITPGRKKELEKKGYTVITDKAKALDKKFLVVGCSGHRSIDMSDFAKMSSPVFLASASSKRVEIDTIGLGELSKDDEGQLRRILAAKVNEQETWHYFLKDGRIITAMADGLPVNFQAVNSIAPELIDHTMALMLLGSAQAMTSKAKGLDLLEPAAQFRLQAQMEGLNIGTNRVFPVAEQEWISLEVDGQKFRGAHADWMRIAKSPATPPEVLHELFVKMVNEQPGEPGDYMNPIVLAILESKHDLPEKTIDFVLERQLLPWVSRLVNNEAINEKQQDRLLDWLEKAFWNAAGANEQQPVEKYAAVAVTGDPQIGHKYWYADVVEQQGRTYLKHGVTTVRDHIVHQASDILFGHVRAPLYLKEAILRDPYGMGRQGLASTVIRMRSPVWSTEELDKVFPEMFNAAWSHLQSVSSKSAEKEFGYDLLQSFRDHPNASAEVAAQADRAMREMKEFLIERRQTSSEFRGIEGWQMSPLGIPLPAYP